MDEIQKDYQLYQSGLDYNNKLHYYETVDKNYRFYEGDHWYGVAANGQPTLIMPVYQRVADHEIATILSSPLKAQFSIENFDSNAEGADDKQHSIDVLNHKCEDKWEKDKIDSMLRECLIDGFNTGDYCIYVTWDGNINTKQYNGIDPQTQMPIEIIGEFKNELIDGGNVMFGNANDRRVEPQPYILLIGRGLVKDLREKAKANGISKEDILKITGDTDYQQQIGDRGKIEIDSDNEENSKCLYIIKLWKQNGTVWTRQSTKYALIEKDKDTGLKRYPVAWGNWKKRKGSYHGQAPGTGMVPNQISINTLYSMIVYHMRMTAFGKVIYDSTKIDKWTNGAGKAIPVNGEITNVAKQLETGQMNQGIFNFATDLIVQTKDLNGANDAALGDVNPEQASGIAIVSTAKQSAIPLETPSENLKQFVEDLMLIWEDFIESKYTVPRQIGYQEKGISKVDTINGQEYQTIPLSIKIDVGPSAQWSEITSVATLDKLLLNKEISLLQYLERLPDGFINDKQGLIDELKSMQQDNTLLYQQMDKFLQTLPPDMQAQLEELRQKDPQAFEQQVKQLMMQSDQEAPQM
jgi:hypothetical protein